MKCENCKTNEATFFYEEIINGESKSLRLCAACAAKMKGEHKLFTATDSALPFHANFLDGLFGLSGNTKSESGKSCPGCSATWQELRNSGKAVCPRCYETFGEELKPTLRSLHGNVTHVGRAPAGRRAQKEKRDRLADLKNRLAEAIRDEKFEDAAALRDEIRGLEKE
ncbi:MAG: hypothetical protein E7585_09050 [Ruminococcaceae bacterium]|nr:hypothetical protein [Oscillospiraceae bacterium]